MLGFRNLAVPAIIGGTVEPLSDRSDRGCTAAARAHRSCRGDRVSGPTARTAIHGRAHVEDAKQDASSLETVDAADPAGDGRHRLRCPHKHRRDSSAYRGANRRPTAASTAAPTGRRRPPQPPPRSAPARPRRFRGPSASARSGRRIAECERIRVHGDELPRHRGCLPRLKATPVRSARSWLDEHTVEFDLCTTDVAFLAKVAFASLGINDSDYLIRPDGSILNSRTAPAHTCSRNGSRATTSPMPPT